MKKLAPGTRNLLVAVTIIAVLHPVLLTATLAGATWIATGIAAILLARVSPAHTHRGIHRITGTTIAGWITGHQPTPAPARTYKHAPSSGPEIPVPSHTR